MRKSILNEQYNIGISPKAYRVPGRHSAEAISNVIPPPSNMGKIRLHELKFARVEDEERNIVGSVKEIVLIVRGQPRMAWPRTSSTRNS